LGWTAVECDLNPLGIAHPARDEAKAALEGARCRVL
jgi:hypothetical protein